MLRSKSAPASVLLVENDHTVGEQIVDALAINSMSRPTARRRWSTPKAVTATSHSAVSPPFQRRCDLTAWDDHTLRRIRNSVFAVHGRHGPVGTATVIAHGVALTALHVIAPGQPHQLRLGDTTQATSVDFAVRAAVTLPLEGYRTEGELARRSIQRARRLTGTRDSTVDLALLSVPGLCAPVLPVRAAPVRDGESVMVPGYPAGQWSIAQGPIVSHDNADLFARVSLDPGAGGAPVIDQHGGLTGVVTLDTETGIVCIGPRLLITFIRRLWAGPDR
jgi:Trypsin-like peptidase domain